MWPPAPVPDVRQKPLHATREEYRADLLRAIADHPGASRTAVRMKAWRSFEWLHMHDAEWLDAQLPPRRWGHPDDDGLRDEELARGVEAADRIRARPGYPRRITRRAIALELDTALPDPRRPHRYPRTVAVLARVLESSAVRVERRIAWAAAELKPWGSASSPSRLREMAHMGHRAIDAHPSAQAAIDAAIGNSSVTAANKIAGPPNGASNKPPAA